MRFTIVPVAILMGMALSLSGCAQSDDFTNEVATFQAEKNALFRDSLRSPLTNEDRVDFEGLPFYPANAAFRVRAQFEPLEAPVVEFPTTTDRIARYRPHGKLFFELDGASFVLTVYAPMAFPGNRAQAELPPLFLPFTDLTNGEGSYGGGRYIDIERQKGAEWILDFNKSYNPYCAYNDRYSCPVPPEGNHLETRIEAGVRYPEGY